MPFLTRGWQETHSSRPRVHLMCLKARSPRMVEKQAVSESSWKTSGDGAGLLPELSSSGCDCYCSASKESTENTGPGPPVEAAFLFSDPKERLGESVPRCTYQLAWKCTRPGSKFPELLGTTVLNWGWWCVHLQPRIRPTT